MTGASVWTIAPARNDDEAGDGHSAVERWRLRVLDTTAVSLCMENNMPIVVLNFWQKDSVKRLILGETVGTTISP